MRPEDQELYEIAGQELLSKSLKLGLWTMAFAKADGDETRAKAIYIELRVADLRTEVAEKRANQKLRQKEEQRENKRRLEEEQRENKRRLEKEEREAKRRLEEEDRQKAAAEEEASKELNQLRLQAINELQHTRHGHPFKAKIKVKNSLFYEKYLLYILPGGLYFVSTKDPLSSYYVAPEFGDQIKLKGVVWYFDENVYIKLSSGLVLKVIVDGWGPYQALKDYVERQFT